jgi:hypothetical protein
MGIAVSNYIRYHDELEQSFFFLCLHATVFPLSLSYVFAHRESAQGDCVFESKMVLWALSVRGAQIPELTGCA